jgi:hypothetical protein
MKCSTLALVAVLIAGLGCGDDGGDGTSAADAGAQDAAAIDAGVDAAVDGSIPPDANLYPPSLRDTGLYSDFDNRIIASDVFEYEVAYPLWSDGAEKRRWVHLPAGTKIDTIDMDSWVYPEGTKLWKEFSDNGLLLETRLLWKTGPTTADWIWISYGWNMAQTEALEMPDGADDVLGTTFDIPDQRNCSKCHERTPDIAIGFSAIQLAHAQEGVTLDSLVTDSLLTTNPPGLSPYFTVPGVGDAQAVLGYFHGNCGGCHNPTSDVMDTTNLNLRLEVATLGTVEETTSYTTIVGIAPQLGPSGPTALIDEEGDPAASMIFFRMGVRDGPGLNQMPPRGTEAVDSDFMLTLSAWITSLAP